MNKGILQAIILYGLLVLVMTVHAQPTYKLTVNELFEKGIEYSLAIKTSELKVSMSQDRISLAKNKLLPDIQVTGQFGYVGTSSIFDRDLSFIKHTDAPDWKQNYQVVAVQPLYQGGRIKGNIKKWELDQEISRLSLEKDKSGLKLWLIGKYLDLYNFYKERDSYELNIQEAKRRLQDIRKMREEGMITTNDVLRSEIQLSNYELSLKETNNNITLVSQQLAIVMGMDENLIFEPDMTYSNPENHLMGIKDYIQSAYENYPDIRISKTNLDLARNNLKVTKADFLPALSMQFGNTFQRPIPNTSPVQDLYLNSWGVTLNLSYHISALFDRKHSLSLAKTQISLLELAEEQQRQNIRTGVKAAYLKHQEALDRVKVLEHSLMQANENYRIVNKKYFNQLAILTDLLDANTVQLNAELQLTAARTNVIYTYYQLLNISGKL